MDELIVVMHDIVAGVLVRPTNGRLRFDYDFAYRTLPNATPLSRSMPLSVATHSDAVVAPWLWGLLPENDAVLARWGRQFHVSPSSPFALLGTPVGEDCAGAVRFCRRDDVERLIGRVGSIEWLDDGGVEARIRDLRQDATTWLGRDFTGQFSLAGAQAKTALYSDGDRWGVPSGATPTTHILKPAIQGFDDHELNEHICLDAARRVGLRTVRTRVERFGAESVIVVRRYDRALGDDGIARIHQEDMCQALGVSPTRKYQNEGGPGAADIIGLLRRELPALEAASAVDRFVDALIWNWVIAGTDAHAKNYSLLLAARNVRIAPLYDIASALPYGIHVQKLRMAMKIGGDYDLASLRDRWTKAAKQWNLDAERLRARVVEVVSVTGDAFASAAADPSVASLGRATTARLVDLVAHRASTLIGQLKLPPP